MMAATTVPAERASGTNTGFRQITDTISFEMKRNWKRTLIFCIAEVVLFVFLSYLYEYLISTGYSSVPVAPEDFPGFYFSPVSFYQWFVSFIAIFLGAASIAQDYEKQTGHQLFPRISRGRLLAGRVIGLYILYAIVLGLYYMLIGVYTAIKFDGVVPIELLWSLGFALLYALATLSFIFLLSALLNAGGAFGLGIGTLVFVFLMLEMFIPMLFKIEPIFILSYYFKILSGIFDMPETRYADRPNSFNPSVNSRTWLTPSVEGALLGMLIYIVVCLGLAYLRFRKRQLIS